MERVIDFSPKEWEQLKRAVDSIRVELCQKAGIGPKKAFKGFYARRGLDLPEWKRLCGELSFPAVKDENTVIFNYYNNPRGKGGLTKSGAGSYKGVAKHEVMTFSFDAGSGKLRVPNEFMTDLESIVGFMRDKSTCRTNIIELHDHVESSVLDGLKSGDFRPPLFQSVDVIMDGETKHYFFDQSDPVLENRLRHEECAVLHKTEEMPHFWDDILTGHVSREGAAPAYSRMYYNGDGLVSRGELMKDLNAKDFGQVLRDEMSLELAVNSVNRTALCMACAMAGIEPEVEDLKSGFAPQQAKVLSYLKGGALSVFHGETLFGPRSGASNLPEAVKEVFSENNLRRLGEEYRVFCLERAKSRSV